MSPFAHPIWVGFLLFSGVESLLLILLLHREILALNCSSIYIDDLGDIMTIAGEIRGIYPCVGEY
jgi:hypothetical protein